MSQKRVEVADANDNKNTSGYSTIEKKHGIYQTVTVVREVYNEGARFRLSKDVDILIPDGKKLKGHFVNGAGILIANFEDGSFEQINIRIPEGLTSDFVRDFDGEVQVVADTKPNKISFNYSAHYGDVTIQPKDNTLNFEWKDQRHIETLKKNIAEIIYINGDLVIIHDDRARNVLSSEKVRQIAYSLVHLTDVDRNYHQEANKFFEKIKTIPKKLRSPDGYKVRKTMRSVYHFLEDEYQRTKSDADKQELTRVFHSLNLMIEKPEKSANVLLYSRTNPINNVVAASALFLGSAVLFSLSIAAIVLLGPGGLIGLFGVMLSAGPSVLGCFQVDRASSKVRYKQNTEQLNRYFWSLSSKTNKNNMTDDAQVEDPLSNCYPQRAH